MDLSVLILCQACKAGQACAIGRHFVPREFLGIPALYVWNFFFLLVLAFIFYWLIHGSTKKESKETALELLKKKYVKGEIGKEEYLEKKKDITQ